MIQHERCPLTGSSDIKKVFEVKDYTVSGKMFPVFESENVNYRFTNPVPSQEELPEYYKSEAYVSHSQTKEGLVNRLFHVARIYTMRYKKRAVCHNTGKKEGKLLDYGCGTGDFIRFMQNAGWQCSGYEPDPDARETATQNTGANISGQDGLENLEHGQFDCITLWHVLEHVYEPGNTIEHLLKLLKPGGVILFALPNYNSADAEFYREFWAGYDVPRHLHHFTYQSFSHLAEKNNMHIPALQRMHLDSFYVSMLSEKYLAEKGSQFRGVWQGFKSWLAALFNKKRGSSIMYVGRRKN